MMLGTIEVEAAILRYILFLPKLPE